MDMLQYWIPAGATTGSFAVILWLCRSLISTRLTKSVENEFNRKLENVKAELRTKEAQIDALRSGAMSGLPHSCINNLAKNTRCPVNSFSRRSIQHIDITKYFCNASSPPPEPLSTKHVRSVGCDNSEGRSKNE